MQNNQLDQILHLLAGGLKTSEIATACGCSDSYVSQLRQTHEEQISAIKLANSEKQNAKAQKQEDDFRFDTLLERAEQLALERIERNLPMANFGQSMAAFRILNSARRRNDVNVVTTETVNVTVNLTLPQNTVPQYVTNQKNEIIEVEGKTMLSATMAQLPALTKRQESIALTKASERLDNLRIPIKTPRRSPLAISPDMI